MPPKRRLRQGWYAVNRRPGIRGFAYIEEHLMDTTTNDSGSAFPVDRPVESLIRDHNLVRTLVETYRNSDSDAVKINAAEQILMLMETHSLLEESVFYPAVREIDPTLIGHFEQEHQKTDQILVELKRMSLNDPQALPLFEQLIELHLQHVEEEENQFFPRLEQAGIDMMPIGLQMQAFEANMVHVQAQATQQGAR
ncbi:hemerythrin domain-containing protein [Noviherbaspirillum sp.]|uniref:hemerythrin domain-containing protein n=1 Tax=Noviherbaspirillum sp. TaxID=1926288 RepID=UPI002DDDA8FE|nr:hemerythrin domain-containing protein [Noviherbaspirillum sp.]